jgi:hypothetical protein
VANLDNDTHLDLVVGQDLGGLFLLEDEPGSDLSIQANKIESIEIYPNPFDHQLTVRYDGAAPLTIQLFDLEGSCLAKLELAEAEQQIQLDFLENGVYLLKFSNGVVRKVIKKN